MCAVDVECPFTPDNCPMNCGNQIDLEEWIKQDEEKESE